MNTDKTFLQRRIEFIQDILDNPSQLDVPHPKGYSWPAYSISKEEIEHLKLDNTISSHLLTQQINPNKLLFKAHQFQKHETTLTNFEYDKCRVDYCFVYDNDGLQQPYAIGIEMDETFNGWWARHPKVTLPLITNPLRKIPLFFVTKDQIFVEFCGLYSELPRADKLDGIPQFIDWLEEMKAREREPFSWYEGELPTYKLLKTIK